MPASKKTPARRPIRIYLDSKLAKTPKVKAALIDGTLSDLVNEALVTLFRQDESDLRLMRERRKQPSRPYEEFAAELRRDGLI